jgi:6-phosphogluconolactonase
MMKLTTFLLLLFTLHAFAQPSSKIIVGTQTTKGSEGIYAIIFNPKDTSLSDAKLIYQVANPTYLTISEDGKHIYTVSETHGGSALALTWDEHKETLVKKAEHTTRGAHPCYISLDRKEEFISVANFSGGSVILFDTAVIETGFKQHEGGFENSRLQNKPHAHCSLWSPDNRFLLTVDLGLDAIIAYPFEKGKLGEGIVALQLPEGNGIRHLVFNQKGYRAYLAAELSSTVYALEYDKEKGRFSVINTLSTLPTRFTEKNTVADIHLSKDGRFVYVSNRGHNSIASYKVKKNGAVEALDIVKCQGEHPRNFVVSPDGRFLLVANRDTNNITIFSIDQKMGTLTYIRDFSGLQSPTCLKFYP